MSESVTAILQSSIQSAIRSAAQHLTHDTRDTVLGLVLARFTKGTGKTVLTLACYADSLRIVFSAIASDGKISKEEIDQTEGFLAAVAAAYATVRPEYAKFATLQRADIGAFLKQYRSDAGPFGFKDESTRWSGIGVCQNIADQSGDSTSLDALRNAFVHAAEVLLAADGMTDEEEVYLNALKAELRVAGSNEQRNQIEMSDETITSDYESCEELLRTGKGRNEWIEENCTRMKSWQEAADAGDARGQVLYGLCFYYGHGEEEDSEQAVNWFTKSADQGNAQGQVSLGQCFYHGDGVEEDNEEAVRWFTRSAEQGNAQGQHVLGLCHFSGEGVEEDEEEAVKWFTKSANQGNADGQFRLGQCFYYGQGVKEDKEEALKWFGLAADQGHEEVIELLEEEARFEELTADAVLDMAKGKNDIEWYDMFRFRSIGPDAAEAICKKLNRNSRTDVDLQGITELSADVVQILNSKAWLGNESNWCTPDLNLDGLTELDLDVAQELSKRFDGLPDYMSPGSLSLNGLQTLNVEQASCLMQFPGDVTLDGLSFLDEDVSAVLFTKSSGDLSLGAMRSLSPGSAALLRSFKGTVSFENLEELTPELISILSADEEFYGFWFNSVTAITDDVAQAISRVVVDRLSEEDDFSCNINLGVKSLSVFAAEQLASIPGELSFDDLEDPGDNVLLALAKNHGDLSLKGISHLTDKAAAILAEHQHSLTLEPKHMSVAAATRLVKHAGNLTLGWDDEWKETFTAEVTDILRQHPSLFTVESGEEGKLPEQLATALAELTIQSICGNYDGSGDDGEMTFNVEWGEGESDETDGYEGLKGFADVIFDSLQNQSISVEKCTEVLSQAETLIWSAIPRGWEINEGSFGSAYIDVESASIRVEHSPRDEDSEDYEDEDDSDEDDGDDDRQEEEGDESSEGDGLSSFGNSESVVAFLKKQNGDSEAGDWLKDPEGTLVNSIGMKLVPIEPGEFQMGDPDCDEGENLCHTVRITKNIYIGMFAVTQGEYFAVTGHNPSCFLGKTRPVDHLSWQDAKNVCELLSQLPEEAAAGRRYRLPSEAEWEYACRAGAETDFCFGSSADPGKANFSDHGGQESPQPTLPVGCFKPNSWGLYDTHGNVWEWCSDWFDDEYFEASPLEDPAGPDVGDHHALRGGAASNAGYECSSYMRGEASQCDGPSPEVPADGRFEELGDFGMRVVCEISGDLTN